MLQLLWVRVKSTIKANRIEELVTSKSEFAHFIDIFVSSANFLGYKEPVTEIIAKNLLTFQDRGLI